MDTPTPPLSRALEVLALADTEASKLERLIVGPTYGAVQRLTQHLSRLREILTRAGCQAPEIAQPSNCDRAEDQRSNVDRTHVPGLGTSGDHWRAMERKRWAEALALASATPGMDPQSWEAMCLGRSYALRMDNIAPVSPPVGESACLAMAQSICKVAAGYIDQAAASSPSPTHALLYSAISGLLRGDFDEHLIRFISGGVTTDAQQRLETLRGIATTIAEDRSPSEAMAFVKALAQKERA